jgi:hypothetical protein
LLTKSSTHCTKREKGEKKREHIKRKREREEGRERERKEEKINGRKAKLCRCVGAAIRKKLHLHTDFGAKSTKRRIFSRSATSQSKTVEINFFQIPAISTSV